MSEKGNNPLIGQMRNWLANAFRRWLIPFVAFGFIIVHMIWPRLVIDAITLGLLVIMILPWLPTLIESAVFPGGWELTFRKIEKEQNTQRDQIKSTKFVIERLITPYESGHLRHIQEEGKYEVRNNGPIDIL